MILSGSVGLEPLLEKAGTQCSRKHLFSPTT